MSAEERLVRAHDLAISAFLADTIYNFGELVRRVLNERAVATPQVFFSSMCEPKLTYVILLACSCVYFYS